MTASMKEVGVGIQVRAASAVCVAAVVAALLTACTGGTSGHPDARPTGPLPTLGTPTALATDTAHGQLSSYCQGLAAAAAKINAAQVALYSGGSSSAVATLEAELKSLQAGAPAQIQAALADLISGFATAEKVLAHPTKRDEAELAALAPKLSADAQQISSYVISKCPAR
jgi:hypothetical protein